MASSGKEGDCLPRATIAPAQTATNSDHAGKAAVTIKIQGTGRVEQASQILQDHTGAFMVPEPPEGESTCRTGAARTCTVHVPNTNMLPLVKEFLQDMGWQIVGTASPAR